jgi:hypothetical protein
MPPVVIIDEDSRSLGTTRRSRSYIIGFTNSSGARTFKNC